MSASVEHFKERLHLQPPDELGVELNARDIARIHDMSEDYKSEMRGPRVPSETPRRDVYYALRSIPAPRNGLIIGEHDFGLAFVADDDYISRVTPLAAISTTGTEALPKPALYKESMLTERKLRRWGNTAIYATGVGPPALTTLRNIVMQGGSISAVVAAGVAGVSVATAEIIAMRKHRNNLPRIYAAQLGKLNFNDYVSRKRKDAESGVVWFQNRGISLTGLTVSEAILIRNLSQRSLGKYSPDSIRICKDEKIHNNKDGSVTHDLDIQLGPLIHKLIRLDDDPRRYWDNGLGDTARALSELQQTINDTEMESYHSGLRTKHHGQKEVAILADIEARLAQYTTEVKTIVLSLIPAAEAHRKHQNLSKIRDEFFKHPEELAKHPQFHFLKGLNDAVSAWSMHLPADEESEIKFVRSIYAYVEESAPKVTADEQCIYFYQGLCDKFGYAFRKQNIELPTWEEFKQQYVDETSLKPRLLDASTTA